MVFFPLVEPPLHRAGYAEVGSYTFDGHHPTREAIVPRLGLSGLVDNIESNRACR
jgi:hypothetical protein